MILTGTARLGRDAEIRKTNSGDSVANFSIAFNYGRKDQDGSRPTQWVRASLWGRQAEALTPYLLKGQQVTVVMRDVHLEEYDGNSGKVTALVGTISDIELVGGRPQEDNQQPQQQRQAAPQHERTQQQPQRQQAPQQDGFDDDVPF